jgi:hypothetical protein
MQVKQAIQASANVIRVTNVSAGDVYKRYDDSYDDRVYYGVVTAVHNDGETAIIEATEYSYKYSSLDVNLKVLRGDKEYKLFPATPEDLNLELDGVVERKLKDIESKTEEISKLSKEIEEVTALISGDKLKELKGISYKEMTQKQYETKKIEAGI